MVAKCDRYWDLPFNNYNYSYIDHALSHGYSTLSYDRLGIGESSHGDPKSEIQASLEVAALAEMTWMVRKGSFPGIRQKPEKVVHVGHSFGSGQTYALSAMYPDLTDAIVLTGFSMNSSFMPSFLTGANFQQARSQGQSQQGQGDLSQYAPGYLVSSNINANHYLFFHAPPNFDPGMLVFAEQSKKPVAVGELMTSASVPMQSGFTGPVLIITGSHDLPFCGGDCLNTGGAAASIPAQGKVAFPEAKAFEAYVQPETGHGLNMHYNATGAYDYIVGFLGGNGIGA